MSAIESFYRRHGRPFSLGRLSPLGLAANGVSFGAIGLAQVPDLPATAQNPLMLTGVVGMLLGLVDVGLASLVGAPPLDLDPIPRRTGETRTYPADRLFLTAMVPSTFGMAILVYGMVRLGLVSGAWSAGVPVVAFAGLWFGVLLAMSPRLAVRVDDAGIAYAAYPLRRRFVPWERIDSVSVRARDSSITRVVLDLHDDPTRYGAGPTSASISTSMLTVRGEQLCLAIASDPRLRAAPAPAPASGHDEPARPHAE